MRPFVARSATLAVAVVRAVIVQDAGVNVRNGFDNFVKFYKQPEDDVPGRARQAVILDNRDYQAYTRSLKIVDGN